MKWQLEVVVEGEKYRGLRVSARAVRRRQYRSGQFPDGGASRSTPRRMPPNYVARLGQVATRMQEATCRSARACGEGHDAAAVHRSRDDRADAAVHQRRRQPRTRLSLRFPIGWPRVASSRRPGARSCGRQPSAITATQIYPAWQRGHRDTRAARRHDDR